MIRFMLDTSICVDLIRGRRETLLRKMKQFAVDEIAISSITLAELQYGVEKSANPAKHSSLLADFCAPLEILPFDDEDAEHYGQIRAALERAGTSIGPLDMLIAAHAVSVGCTLVTNNEREFSRVDGLTVENWAAES